MQKNKGLVQYAEEYGTYPYGMRNMGHAEGVEEYGTYSVS